MHKQQGNTEVPQSLFISYAHEDEPLRQQLETHLSLLRRQGLIADWHDRQILAGDEWAHVIDQHLEGASIILLLISPDFLASDYCYEIEMGRALERHKRGEARVIPIILRPVDWQNAPFAHLQCLPCDGKSVMEWGNQDAAFRNITQGVRRAIARIPGPTHSVARLSSVAQQNRQRLLKRVRTIWITGVLEQSLHQAALIALNLQEQPDALANPWHFEAQETNRSPRRLPPGTSLVWLYDEADGEVLLLGEPGAGKTTLLLELASTLLVRAEQEEGEPMPVVFNLSSWTQKRQPLADWLVEELSTKYQVPRKIGKDWVNTNQILPLLDGLDEVAEDARIGCIRAITTYHQHCLLEQGAAPLVICCRSHEYMVLPTRVTLQQAISIQPLTDEQIEHYLQSAKGQLEGLRHALYHDPELYEMAQYPLMLSVLTLAYQGTALEMFPKEGPDESLLHQVWATYVKCMLSRRGVSQSVSREHLLRWLTFIAARMMQKQQMIFYLESMQPTWLINWQRRLLYRLSIGLFTGLIGGLPFGLISGLWVGPFSGLVVGLVFGLVFGLIGGLLFGWSRIQPKETFSWSLRITRRSIVVGLIVGLAFGLLFGLIVTPIFGLVVGLVLGPTAGLTTGFSANQLDGSMRLIPNQGVRRSIQNGLFFLLFGGLVAGPVFGLVFGLGYGYGLNNGLSNGLGFGLSFGLSFGLLGGLGAFFQHFTLRFWLWCTGSLPWNLIPFLDEATELLLLHKVGGGYIFIHRLLLEYFASLETPSSLETLVVPKTGEQEDL